MTRSISYSEVDTLLTCQAKHDFRYGDFLAGSSLREKAVVPLLSGGRAWGAAVAAWHVHANDEDAGAQAILALDASLEWDADRQREHGVHDQESHDELRMDLLAILGHYVTSAPHVLMDKVVERELSVSLPSRSGKRASNRFRMLAFVDATESTDEGVWLDEFKLRGQLSPAKLIVSGRQIRWYAWAYERQYGERVLGVYVNERLRQAPKPARVLKSGKPSHAVNQLCTPEAYEALCLETQEEPKQTTVDALAARDWQRRTPVIFREEELEEAGRELVSAAHQIALFDTGKLEPVRNVSRMTCSHCSFQEICPAPDPALVDALFERLPAKGGPGVRNRVQSP